MIRILLTGIFLLACLVLPAQSKKQVRELKIKGATETTTLYRDGKAGATYKSQAKTFDKEGNTLTDIEYNPDGSVKRMETNKYSGKEKIEEVTEEHPSKGDDDGGNNKYKKVAVKYNSKGDKTEETEYNAAGNVVKRTTYAYNSSGDRQFEMVYDTYGKLVKKITYGYDSKGLRTEKKITGPDETLLKHIRYTYTY
jgi:hypothetical protein